MRSGVSVQSKEKDSRSSRAVAIVVATQQACGRRWGGVQFDQPQLRSIYSAVVADRFLADELIGSLSGGLRPVNPDQIEDLKRLVLARNQVSPEKLGGVAFVKMIVYAVDKLAKERETASPQEVLEYQVGRKIEDMFDDQLPQGRLLSHRGRRVVDEDGAPEVTYLRLLSRREVDGKVLPFEVRVDAQENARVQQEMANLALPQSAS